MSSTDQRAQFEAMFRADPDPWKFKERWYEARKRALTLACLTRPRYESAFEPGCANGELSAALAERCDRLLISDGAPAALELARSRVAASPNVSTLLGWMPEAWPAGDFDLIVVSELAYFLTPEAIDALGDRARKSLRAGGDVVGCHWRHPIDGYELDGDAAHARFGAAVRLPLVWSLIEPDFRISIWSAETSTVAQRDGLVPQPNPGSNLSSVTG